jgi:hypothetical protein
MDKVQKQLLQVEINNIKNSDFLAKKFETL